MEQLRLVADKFLRNSRTERETKEETYKYREIRQLATIVKACSNCLAVPSDLNLTPSEEDFFLERATQALALRLSQTQGFPAHTGASFILDYRLMRAIEKQYQGQAWQASNLPHDPGYADYQRAINYAAHHFISALFFPDQSSKSEHLYTLWKTATRIHLPIFEPEDILKAKVPQELVTQYIQTHPLTKNAEEIAQKRAEVKKPL